MCLMFHQCNTFLYSKLSNFTAKLTLHYKKKYLSSIMTTRQCKFSMLYCHYYNFRITESEKSYMKNKIFDESTISMC